MTDPNVAVVGGGIAGMSTALFCARRGWSVDLFEQGRLGSGATNAAAGVLIPPSFLDRALPDHTQNSYALLSEKGYQFYPDFIDLLDEYSMFETGFNRCGTWHLATSEQELDQRRTCFDEMQKYDRDVQWADGDELRAKHDPLSESVLGGYFYAEEAQVDPGRVTQALRDALVREEVSIHERTEISSISSPSGGSHHQIETADETRKAERVVIAAGCWSNKFSDDLQQEIRVEPRKGQMIKLRENLGNGPMFEVNETHVVPRMDGTVDVGATVEDVGFDTEVTKDARSQILDTARRIFPRFSVRSVIDQWSGLRPYAKRKGGPFLGDVPARSGIYVNAGHYQKGILQAPYSGYILAQYMAGDEPDLNLEPYRVDR